MRLPHNASSRSLAVGKKVRSVADDSYIPICSGRAWLGTARCRREKPNLCPADSGWTRIGEAMDTPNTTSSGRRSQYKGSCEQDGRDQKLSHLCTLRCFFDADAAVF